MIEIRLLTDKDVYVREFAKQTFQAPNKALASSSKEKEVVKMATEARVKRARENLTRENPYIGHNYRGGRSGGFRGGGYRGRGRPRFWHANDNHNYTQFPNTYASSVTAPTFMRPP